MNSSYSGVFSQVGSPRGCAIFDPLGGIMIAELSERFKAQAPMVQQDYRMRSTKVQVVIPNATDEMYTRVNREA